MVKVNEINLDLVTAAWSEDTKEICYSEKCLAGISSVRIRVGALRNRDERCVSPRAYRTMIRVSIEKKKAIDTRCVESGYRRITRNQNVAQGSENTPGKVRYSSLAHSRSGREINYC